MFTGLIEAVGEVAEIRQTSAGFRIRLMTELAKELTVGQSLAVNGVCLTAVIADNEGLSADVSPETVRVTTLGSLKSGALVNIERPLRLDGFMGGHFVNGHVDCRGVIEEIRKSEESHWLSVSFPKSLEKYVVSKGSIAIDGISLTVAAVSDQRFDVQIVPYTWDHTNFRVIRAMEFVNIECDIIGKYVVRLAECLGKDSEFLKNTV